MSLAFEHRVRAIFDEATKLPEAGRTELLSRMRQTEPDVADEVEALLLHHSRSTSVLDQSPVAAIAVSSRAQDDPSRDARDDLPLPASFGRYTLLRVIGEGGMGVVYEAQQAQPRRAVAIKLIRPEFLTPSTMRRFEHEAEALGMVDHPSVARVYEAGRAELKGIQRAYIAMELVRGIPITDFARQRDLPESRRIELLADVCDGVEAAHRRGVIHRDIKPANILVADDGRPRILDFGVARLASIPGRATMITRSGQIIGTLAYMSPEQALGDPMRVDSRADVYSLGAVLFELLAGHEPIRVSGLSLPGALAAIQAAEFRIPRDLRRILGRDVEAILLRALERDPAGRYQHASELAEDLRRLLRSEPVAAVAPTRLYQFARFCRRNRELVAAGLVVIVTLSAAFIATGTALVRERTARTAAVRHAREADLARDEALRNADHAQRNYERNRAVAQFMRAFLGGVRAEVARGRDTELLRSILEESERNLPMLDSQPVARSDMHTLFGDIFRDLGDLQRAEDHYLQSLDIYRQHLGDLDRATAVSLHNLGALYRGSLRRYDDAEPLLQEALQTFIQLSGPDDPDTRNARNSLALLYLDTARYEQAEPLLRELRLAEERIHGVDHIAAQRAIHNHAGVLSMIGRIREAHQLALHVYNVRSRQLGEDHPATIVSSLFLSSLWRALRQPEQSLPLVQSALTVLRGNFGDSHPRTLTARAHLIVTLRDLNHFEEALSEADAAISLAVDTLGQDHIDAIQLRLLAIELRILLGRCDGVLDDALVIRSAVAELGDRFLLWQAVSEKIYGFALTCAGDVHRAEETLLAAHQTLKQMLTGNHRFTQRAAELLAQVYISADRPDHAAQWQMLAADID